MMTRFKLSLIACLLGVGAFASTPSELFTTHREQILSAPVTQCETYCFGVGSAKASSSSANARRIAKEKAALLALDHLIRYSVLRDVVWPDALFGGIREQIASAYIKCITVDVKIKKAQTVSVFQHGEEDIAVVALPMAEVAKLPRVSFPDIFKRLSTEKSLFSGLLSVDALIALQTTQGPLPPVVNRVPWEIALREARFSIPKLKYLPQFAGRYPIGTTDATYGVNYQRGMQAYQKGDLVSAYEAFLAETEQTFSYDALNMAGNVARRIGKSAEAVPLLLHATYLNPKSPHPWVHLGFAAKSLEDLELAESCCVLAEERSMDQWSQTQVAIIRKEIQEAKAALKEVSIEGVEEDSARQE